MNYIYLAVLASVLWSLVNITDKYVIEKYNPDPWIPVFVLGVVGFIISLVIYLTEQPTIFDLKIFSLSFILGVLYLLGCIFYIRALQLDDISKLAPLFLLNPLLVLPFSVFIFGQQYTYANLFGICLMVFGTILVTFNDKLEIKVNRAIWYVLLSILCGPAVSVITKHLLGSISVTEVFCYSRFGFFIAMVPIFIFNKKKLKIFYQSHGVKPFKIMFGNQFLNMTGVLICILATSKGDVTIVSALSSLQPVFIIFICLGLKVFLPKIKVDSMSIKVASIRLIAIFIIFSGLTLASLPKT